MFDRQHRRQLTGVEKLINTRNCICHFQRNHCRLHHDANILQCITPGRSTGEAHSAEKTGPLEIETIEPASGQPTHSGSLLECAAPGRSSQCGTRGFPGLTANPQHMLGPSWSVRLLAAPRSVGPAVFLGSPPTHNTCWVPPGVCGSWPLLAVWDPRFSWVHRQPTQLALIEMQTAVWTNRRKCVSATARQPRQMCITTSHTRRSRTRVAYYEPPRQAPNTGPPAKTSTRTCHSVHF